MKRQQPSTILAPLYHPQQQSLRLHSRPCSNCAKAVAPFAQWASVTSSNYCRWWTRCTWHILISCAVYCQTTANTQARFKQCWCWISSDATVCWRAFASAERASPTASPLTTLESAIKCFAPTWWTAMHSSMDELPVKCWWNKWACQVIATRLVPPRSFSRQQWYVLNKVVFIYRV